MFKVSKTMLSPPAAEHMWEAWLPILVANRVQVPTVACCDLARDETFSKALHQTGITWTLKTALMLRSYSRAIGR